MGDNSPLHHSSLQISPGVMANLLGALSIQPIPQKVKSLHDSVKFWKFLLNHETPLNML